MNTAHILMIVPGGLACAIAGLLLDMDRLVLGGAIVLMAVDLARMDADLWR